MGRILRIFKLEQRMTGAMTWGDGVVIAGIAGLLFAGIKLAGRASGVIQGPSISLSPGSLPVYAALSLGRMSAAYGLSILFTLVYGYQAAHHRRAERILLPVLDILQSVPILSFLPVVLLSLNAVLPQESRNRARLDRSHLHQPGMEPDLLLVPVPDHHPQGAPRGGGRVPA